MTRTNWLAVWGVLHRIAWKNVPRASFEKRRNGRYMCSGVVYQLLSKFLRVGLFWYRAFPLGYPVSGFWIFRLLMPGRPSRGKNVAKSLCRVGWCVFIFMVAVVVVCVVCCRHQGSNYCRDSWLRYAYLPLSVVMDHGRRRQPVALAWTAVCPSSGVINPRCLIVCNSSIIQSIFFSFTSSFGFLANTLHKGKERAVVYSLNLKSLSVISTDLLQILKNSRKTIMIRKRGMCCWVLIEILVDPRVEKGRPKPNGLLDSDVHPDNWAIY